MGGRCLQRVARLVLAAHFPMPPHPAPQHLWRMQVVELTAAGRQFFTAAFERFDQDDDGVLSVREREEMFSTAPAE